MSRDGSAIPLLATLDAALPGADAPWPDLADGADGLEAALRLHALLAEHGLGWNDVLAPDSRLAKLCGRLGSAFPGERAAAYHHAVLLVQGLASSWSALLHLPACLLATRANAQPTAVPQPSPAIPAYSAPDGDWQTTLAGLRFRAAWRSTAERQRLEALESALLHGREINARDAVWLRDLWWFAELDGRGEAAE